MIPSILTTLALVASSLSFAGQILYSTITNSSLFVNGSMLQTGHTFILPDSSTTTSPAEYLNDETTPIMTRPITMGTEWCTGHTGALLCHVAIKLTGSGGHRNSNAGSYTCGTGTCSVVGLRVFTESGADALYAGWTTSPGTTSGAQLINAVAPQIPRGGNIIGSGSYTYTGATGLPKSVQKDVPPGATIKFTWKIGDGTEDYSRTKAAAVIDFWKYYTP